MFQRILVLLDGSKRAELALPVAVQLARATGGSLIFLRLARLPADFVWYALEPPFRTQEVLRAATCHASTYLAIKAWEMELAGIPVQTSIIPGIPRQDLHSFIETQAIDLVVMCSRGHIPSRRQAQGSMAQQMLQQSSAPVLVLQEASGPRGILYPRPQPMHILVPLDDSPLAEATLAPVASLAAALSTPEQGFLHLLRVLPESEFLQAEEADSDTKDRAHAYLQTLSQTLRTGTPEQLPLSITTEVLCHPDVTDAIIRVAEGKWLEEQKEQEAETYHLVALTTHGRSKQEHRELSSTAEQLFKRTGLPLLIVPSNPPN